MDLYYSLTLYQILAATVHKMLFNAGHPAHLVVSNSIVYDVTLVKLWLTRVFDRVIVIDDERVWNMAKDVTHQNHEMTLQPTLEKITDYVFSLLPAPPDEYREIYLLAEQFPLGMALAYRNIEYTYFEESAGAHSRRRIYLDTIYNSNAFQFWANSFTGTRGGYNSACKRKYIDKTLQLPDFYDDLPEHFSVVELLSTLSPEQMDMIMYVFNPEADKEITISGSNKVAVIFTGHYANMRIMTFEQQRDLNCCLADYFCDGMSIIVKPHPNDKQGLYKKWMPGVEILPDALPAELIPYKANRSIDRVISLTSVATLIERNAEVVSFLSQDNRSEKECVHMHSYYVASMIISRVLGESGEIISFGADAEQIRMFLKYCFNATQTVYEGLREVSEVEKIGCPDVIVIDKLKYTNATRNDIQKIIMKSPAAQIIIFINNDKDYLFFDISNTENIDDIIPFPFRLAAANSSQKVKEEMIYVFSGSNNVKQELLSIKAKRTLHYCGLDLEIGAEPLNYAALYFEGLLDATEKECIRLLAENEELRKQADR